MRITLTLAAVCACLFGLLLLSGGNVAIATLLVWVLLIGVLVAVVEAALMVTGAIAFFAKRP